MLLEDKVCIVTGVGPGLGHGIATAFARQGARVVLAARTRSYLEEVASQVQALGGHALCVPTDVSDRDQCRRLVASTLEEWGRVDVLVNNAFRRDSFQPFEDVDLVAWRKIADVNLWGSLQLSQEVVAPMKSQAGGSIVFVNSMIVRKYVPPQGGYAVSKGGLMTAAQVLARELGGYGIRVNSVVPGWMWGPGVQMYVKFTSEQRGCPEQEVIDELASQMALGAIPDDDEVAEAVVFLASDLSKVVTGQSIDVNGGEVFH